MSRFSRIALVLTVLFGLLNLFGTVWAAMQGEAIHTGIHAALTLLCGFVVWRISPRRVPTTTY